MAVTETASPFADRSQQRQPLIVGWTLMLLAAFVVLIFGLGTTGNASFRLAFPGDAFILPNLIVPAQPYSYVIAALLAFFGARQFVRGGSRLSGMSKCSALSILAESQSSCRITTIRSTSAFSFRLSASRAIRPSR